MNKDFVEGIGTADDPFQITNWYQLAKIDSTDSPIGAAYLESNYILMNNLDTDTPGYEELAGSSANEEKGWKPIGEYIDEFDSSPFTGTFDGNGFTIYNLNINRAAENHIGLFAYIYSQSVINIQLNNANIIGNNYTAGLAGRIDDSNITNFYVSGNINGVKYVGGLAGQSSASIIDGSTSDAEIFSSANYIGGLIGYNFNSGTINNSNASGDITTTGFPGSGGSYAGGLIGYNDSGSTINNSNASGDVTSTGLGNSGSSVGGLVGHSFKSFINNSFAVGNVSGSNLLGGLAGYFGTDSIEASYVKNSYALGSVTGLDSETTTYGYDVGGLIGRLVRSEIENSYSAGLVTGQNDIGGLIGNNFNGYSNVINSYYDLETTGQNDTGKGSPRTTDEMKEGTPNTTEYTIYTGWDDTGIWDFNDVSSYPELK